MVKETKPIVIEKKARVFKTKEASDLKRYSEAMASQKVSFTLKAIPNKEGVTYIFTTAPITDAKRKAIQTIINQA